MSDFTIITENDISNWDDEKGSKYHFPKRYLKYLNPGTKIIYYKGKIRDKRFESVRLSNEPHYFGIGIIGDVWRESENSSNYFAEIVDYIEFKNAVNFKDPKNNYLEQIPDNRKSNYWRDGVRPVDESFYNLIINLAGLNNDFIQIKSNYYQQQEVNYPSPEFTEDELLKWYEQNNMLVKDSSNKARYSKEAKKIGDEGERIVFQYLETLQDQNIIGNLVWHAREGETPGYDISYIDNHGEKICIEVKATSAKSFMNFIMTANEVESARSIGKNYKIYLVADCFGTKPKMNVIENPTKDKVYKFDTLAYKVYKTKNYDT